MKELPKNVRSYRTTPVFKHDTIPKGLLKNHRTAPGVWGVIHVDKGELEYTIGDNEVQILDFDTKGIIEPEVIHRIKPLTEEVEFKIEFHKKEIE